MVNNTLLHLEDQPARILLIGDIVDGRESLRVHLARVGHEVVVRVGDPNLATLIEVERPDLVCVAHPLDTNRLCARLDELRRGPSALDPPFVVVVDGADAGTRRQLYDAGVDCVLCEPLDSEEAVAAFRLQLRKKRISRTLAETNLELQTAFDRVSDAAARFRSLFEEAMDAVFVVDVETGAIRDCNAAASALSELPAADLVGRSFWDLCPKAPRTAEAEAVEVDFLRAGALAPVQLRANRVRTRQDDVLQYTVRDLTDIQNRRREELDAERLSAVIETAVALNEELNTPLSVIVTSAEAIRHSLRGVDSKMFTRLDYILEAARRARAVLDTLTRVQRVATKEYLSGTQMLDLEASAAEIEKGNSES